MGEWVSLFSGGKDSSWALYQAMERHLDVGRLVTVHPPGDSYMYHVPATELADLAAESIGLPLRAVRPAGFDAAAATDAGTQGDDELEPLEADLRELDAGLRDGLTGVTVGAVASEYQNDRIGAMADRLGIDVFAPLWQREPTAVAAEMIAAGFDVRIISVAAAGLDESWLGRQLDRAALADLESLHKSHGVHVLGEGGEFETLVVDGPHMDHPIEFDADTVWDGTRGRLQIEDAWLAAD